MRQSRAVRDRVQSFASARFTAGQYYDADMARFVQQVAPVVLASRKQVASMTDAYLTSVLKSSGIKVPAHKPVDTSALRGVDVADVYARPFVTVRSGIFDVGMEAAVQAGAARLADLVSTDMQLSRTHAAQNIFSSAGSRVTGYARVPSGDNTCALCEVASTQVYHVEDLMPIHPGCGCSVEPITESNPWDQEAADQKLEDTHASVQDQLGMSDSGARAPDYRKVVVTNEHGEIGPVLGIRGQNFTGPDDLAA